MLSTLRSSPLAKSSVVRAFATKTFGECVKYDVENNVAIITLDTPNSKVNVLSKNLMEDFTKALDHLERSSEVKSAVLISAKADGFIAGADINMLAACKTSAELEELSRNGQQIMNRIEKSSIPIVAAIHGSCLGGGLEVALACHSRVASSSPKTVLGLPEVMLGLLPGAGGTQRLPKLVGAPKALDMILTGKNIRPDRAKSMKLVDVVADPNALKSAAVLVAQQLASGATKKYERKMGMMDRLLEGNRFGIDFMIKKATESVVKKTGGHYPAPLAILDVIKEGLKNGPEAGYNKEALEFGRLGLTPESKSLVSLFFGQTALKKNRFGKPERTYKNIGMIGAGLMGAGIAQVSIEKGFNVILKDRDGSGLARGEQQILGNLDLKVKKRSMKAFDRDLVFSRLQGITASDSFGNSHLRKADMVIEAVFEDLKVKHKVIQELEEQIPEHCILASNTSAIPITDIAKGSKRPQNVIGMHYFSPVDKMPLLEIVTTDLASQEAKAAAVEVGIKQGKTVIVVRDGPGFYTTRILSPFMVEAGGLLQEGVPIKELDQHLKKFGFPVGPVTLFDEVGIDVGNHIQPTLIKAFGERMGGAKTEMMEEMAKAGFCGRKTKAGFFLYEGKKKELNSKAEEIIKKYSTEPKVKASAEEMQQRVVLRMVNEAVYCLEDHTLETPLDGDMGAVFGLGFPPFLGGPFRYIDRLGSQKVVDTLRSFSDKFGPRFAPSPLLVDMAKSGKKFHPGN